MILLPRKNLIDLKQEFAKLRKTGKIYDSPSFGLLVSYSHAPTLQRVAFIVSKKVSLKATDRHEVKRKLADATKVYFAKLSPNAQLVFLAKPQAVEKSLKELTSELDAILGRSKLV